MTRKAQTVQLAPVCELTCHYSVPGNAVFDTGCFDRYTELLEACRDIIGKTENSIILSYWEIGKLVNELRGNRAEYGDKTVMNLAEDLRKDPTTLYRAAKFAELYDRDELLPRGSNLTWGHLKVILGIESREIREELIGKVVDQGLTIKQVVTIVRRMFSDEYHVEEMFPVELFLNRASRLYRFLSSYNTEEIVVNRVDIDKVRELKKLHDLIGVLVEKIP